jgi:hypothetical protein
MPASTSTLTCQKHQFSIPAGHVYLNSAYMGPLPRATLAAGQRALERRAAPVDITPPDFFEPADHARTLCAALVRAWRGTSHRGAAGAGEAGLVHPA